MKDINNYNRIHYWLKSRFGKAYKCENNLCKRRSINYQWCLIKGKSYEKKRENFIMMCRSCHAKYDLTDAGIEKIRKANIGRKHTDETKMKMSLSAKKEVSSMLRI